MYKKIISSQNNSIKGGDIIKTLEKMMAFAGGVGIGLLYKRYEKDISKYMKKASRKMND